MKIFNTILSRLVIAPLIKELFADHLRVHYHLDAITLHYKCKYTQYFITHEQYRLSEFSI